MMKSQPQGTIIGGVLDGVRAILLSVTHTGIHVQLVEDRKAYKTGDKVTLGTGEFRRDDGRPLNS